MYATGLFYLLILCVHGLYAWRSVAILRKQSAATVRMQGMTRLAGRSISRDQRQALDSFLKESPVNVRKYSPRQLKTMLAICMQCESEALLRSTVRKLYTTKCLTTELMTIASRLACRTGNPTLAYCTLAETRSLRQVTDIDSVNAVLEVLADHDKIKPIYDILSDAQRRKYGDFLCDGTSVSALFRTSCRQGDTQPLLDACQFLTTVRSTQKIKTDEFMYQDALNACLLKADVDGSLAVLALYERMHKFVPVRGYAFVLSTYLAAFKKAETNQATKAVLYHGNALRKEQRETTDAAWERLHSLGQFMVDSKLDSHPIVADLILRLLCTGKVIIPRIAKEVGNEAECSPTKGSGDYVQRLYQQYAYIPSMAALTAYTAQLIEHRDVARATLFHLYCVRHGCFAAPELLSISLHHPPNDPEPSSAVLQDQTMALLQTAVDGAKTLNREERDLLTPMLAARASQHLQRTCREANVTAVVHALQAVVTVQALGNAVEAAFGNTTQSLHELVTPAERVLLHSQAPDVVQGSQAFLQMTETILRGYVRQQMVSQDPRTAFLPTLPAYFDIIRAFVQVDWHGHCLQHEQTQPAGILPDELATAGLILLAQMLVEVGWQTAYAELRPVLLQRVPVVVPWLDTVRGAGPTNTRTLPSSGNGGGRPSPVVARRIEATKI